ncbi:MAG: heme exporter protein CcmD [Dongiaceae bacterium]
MGGYAAFIWPAYAVAALVLIAFAIDSWRRVKRAAAALRQLEGQGAPIGAARRRRPVAPVPPDVRGKPVPQDRSAS